MRSMNLFPRSIKDLEVGTIIIFEPRETYPGVLQILGVVSSVGESSIEVYAGTKKELVSLNSIISVVGKSEASVEFSEYIKGMVQECKL